MKLSSETISILKNFAGISAGIFVPGGKNLRVKDAAGKILAEAVVKEDLPSFCVSDLNKFLGVLTLDKDVDIDFQNTDIVIKLMGGKSRINYRGATKNLVNVPKDTVLTLAKNPVTFTLTKDNLDYLAKILSLLSLPTIAIESDGEKTYIRVFDPKNDGENTQTLEIGSGDKREYRIIFNADVLKFVDGDYEVGVSEKIARFKHKTLDIVYWVAPEVGSSYAE